MRSLLVLPLFLALALSEEQQFVPGLDTQQQFEDDAQPMDAAGFEEELLLEEEVHHAATHPEEEMPHPRLVHREGPHPKMTSADAFPDRLEEEEDAMFSPHNPVPHPHPVEEEFTPHHSGAGEGHHHKPHHGHIDIIHHNAVEEAPFDDELGEDEEPFQGTETTLNGDLFEHHPNTGVPELEPTVGTESGTGMEVVQEPVVLPVTEGKNRGQDTVSQYGLPKELMPIHPGGGSKFEDLEKEKLNDKKMAQTKGTDDDEDIENGASHEAEGLYSSAATLCLSALIFSLTSSFRLIV